MAKDDLDLCPDCPLIMLLADIKRRSWTLEPERPSAMQICRRLRAEAMKYPDLSCPYYARETLVSFIQWKARDAWVRRAKTYGLNRFLGPKP